MILFRITTGFFTWDVYKWLMVFLFAAALFSAIIALSLRGRGGRLIYERKRRMMEYSEITQEELSVAAFAKLAIEPWIKSPYGGLLGILTLLLLFAAAIFLR